TAKRTSMARATHCSSRLASSRGRTTRAARKPRAKAPARMARPSQRGASTASMGYLPRACSRDRSCRHRPDVTGTIPGPASTRSIRGGLAEVPVKMRHGFLPGASGLRHLGHLGEIAVAKAVAHIELAVHIRLPQAGMGVERVAQQA